MFIKNYVVQNIGPYFVNMVYVLGAHNLQQHFVKKFVYQSSLFKLLTYL